MQDWLLDKLLARKPLRDVVPSVDAIAARPARALAERPVEILAPKWAPALTIASVALPALGYRFGELVGLSIGVALLAAALISLQIRGRARIRLVDRGITFEDWRRTLFCPWNALDPRGTAVDHMGEILLPLDPRQLGEIEVWERGTLVGRGLEAKLSFVKLRAPAELRITSPFAVRPSELGAFLLDLGRVLGPSRASRPPATSSGATSGDAQTPFPAVEALEGGWLKGSLTRLTFPEHCCACDAPTADWVQYVAPIRFGRILRIFGADVSAHVPVPTCGECQRKIRRRAWRGAAIGFAAGMAGGVLGLFSPLDDIGKNMLFAVGGIIGPIAGFVLAENIGLPVSGRNYAPLRGTVEVRFRSDVYKQRVLRALGGSGTDQRRTG